MKRERAIKRAMYWLKKLELIDPEKSVEIENHLNWLCVIEHEQTIRELQSRNKSKIVQYSLDGIKLAEYDSIRDAAKAVGYGKRYRGGDLIIGNVLAGRNHHTKEGHIWKYAEADGTLENHS